VCLQTDLRLDPFDARWVEVRDAAITAADAGFAGIWVPDHLDGRVFSADHVLECWTSLTAIAVSVSDITVGPLVLNVANHHPGVLAVMAATLQEVSGGRLLFGLGAGGGSDKLFQREQEAIGRTVPPDRQRREAVETCVAEMQRLWNTQGFLQPDPAPRVVIAALGPKMAELAGRVGDGINTHALHADLHELVAIARDAHKRAGRDPTRFLVTVFSEFDEMWFPMDSERRAQLAAIGVDRLVLFLSPPFDRARITEAGRLLRERSP
jgi:alkanesulfonate monooxygenase SsuD/methylene tetrahydromethanopterin reductase-like flavin-dependent oxidoreductase (luciferase family)